MAGNEHRKASTRREINKAANQLGMREKISFTKTLDRIMTIETELLEHARPKKVLQPDGSEIEVEANPVPAVIAALKTVLDSAYKRLNKILPDLKAVDANHQLELAIENDEEAPRMSMVELRQHIKHMLSGGGVDDIETPEPEEQPALPAPDELPDFLK